LFIYNYFVQCLQWFGDWTKTDSCLKGMFHSQPKLENILPAGPLWFTLPFIHFAPVKPVSQNKTSSIRLWEKFSGVGKKSQQRVTLGC
jgi:hypothetical protein